LREPRPAKPHGEPGEIVTFINIDGGGTVLGGFPVVRIATAIK